MTQLKVKRGSGKFKVVEDLHVVRAELEKIKNDFDPKLEEERNQFSEENAKILVEQCECKEYQIWNRRLFEISHIGRNFKFEAKNHKK